MNFETIKIDLQDHIAWREELGARPDPPAVAVTEVPLLYEVGGEERRRESFGEESYSSGSGGGVA